MNRKELDNLILLGESQTLEFKKRVNVELSWGISTKRVEWQISQLKKENLLKRIGPDKGGHWEVLK